MASTVKNYLSLIKFSHTIFAMPFALIGFFLGVVSSYNPYPGESHRYLKLFQGANYILLFFLVILCMIFARSAAMAFNRYLDRKFDAKNPRTAIREIPAGIINEKNALTFVVINCVLFVAATFFINRICF